MTSFNFSSHTSEGRGPASPQGSRHHTRDPVPVQTLHTTHPETLQTVWRPAFAVIHTSYPLPTLLVTAVVSQPSITDPQYLDQFTQIKTKLIIYFSEPERRPPEQHSVSGHQGGELGRKILSQMTINHPSYSHSRIHSVRHSVTVQHTFHTLYPATAQADRNLSKGVHPDNS